MREKGTWIELAGICGFFVLLSLWGIVWAITSGLLYGGIDGIMLVGVCLMTGGIFSLMLLVVLNEAGILPSLKRKKVAAPAAKAAAPANPADAEKK